MWWNLYYEWLCSRKQDSFPSSSRLWLLLHPQRVRAGTSFIPPQFCVAVTLFQAAINKKERTGAPFGIQLPFIRQNVYLRCSYLRICGPNCPYSSLLIVDRFHARRAKPRIAVLPTILILQTLYIKVVFHWEKQAAVPALNPSAGGSEALPVGRKL